MKSYYLILLFAISILSCTPKENQTNSEAVTIKETPTIEFPKNQSLTTEQQITSALYAVPEEGRADAKVYGYNLDNEFTILREGTGDFVCIADNPKKDGFQVAAYHHSLEPYMSRGRILAAEGKSRTEKEEVRSSEAASGILKMPENPSTLHLYYGKNGFFNTATDSIENATYRYVVYIPYATQKTTGLSLRPNEGNHPWLMFPGKYNAHIMITPLK
ncbi:MAG: hypothetical protein KUG51_00445 [Urechidicola sp.]|nr:hypothetical protein [Urechidicola sp.]